MPEEISAEAVRHWREAILNEEWTPKYELDQLAHSDHDRFIGLCYQLLSDASPVVQRVALQKLWERGGDADDAVVRASDLLLTGDVRLSSLIIEILRGVASPAAISALFDMAEAGSGYALINLAHAARFPPHRLRVLRLACDSVFSRDYDLRIAAVAVLDMYLDLRQWEEVALDVARRYMDETVFGMLGSRATPRVIPVLRWLLDRIGPGYAESKDIERAIAYIERRAAAAK
jgi:hypothetical protein